jgi:hypothetical protein
MKKMSALLIFLILSTGLFISCIDRLVEPWQAVGKPGFSEISVNNLSFAIDNTNIPYVAYKGYGGFNVMRFNGMEWNGKM